MKQVVEKAYQYMMKSKADSDDIKAIGSDSYYKVAVYAIFSQVGECNQMSATRGIKKFEEEAIAAISEKIKFWVS